MSYFVLDFESYYDSKQKYGLRQCTTEEYINDPRFHAFGFSILRDGGNPLWVPEEKIEYMLRQLNLHEHVVIAHNAQFDMAILNWKYGVKPRFIIDTLAMARAVLGNEERLSLEELGVRYGIGTKGDAVLHMDGVRHPGTTMTHKLAEYAKNDATMTWKLWEVLKQGFPKLELVVIDITTRMFTEPSFVLDKTPILRELELGKERRERLLLQASCTLEDLRSDEKFAGLLQGLGVTPPKKLSVKKTAAAAKRAEAEGKVSEPVYAWAFAKSDVDFKALGAHENELVQWAVEARLGLKSTIKQSRAERFLSIAQRMGVMPVALTYYGAGTGRYAASSSAKVNMQNLPAIRGSKDPDAGLLRKALRAPPGKVVVVSDASQIEARLVVWQAGQERMLEVFRTGGDPYSVMASQIFGRHVDRKKNPDDYVPGFIGKCVTLGCGYGLGHLKFGSMIYTGMLGGPSVLFDDVMVDTLSVDVDRYSRYIAGKPDMLSRLVELKPAGVETEPWVKHMACAFKIINTFREDNPEVPEYWKTGERMLRAMLIGSDEKIGHFQMAPNKLMLPNGMWLHFKELQFDKKDGYSCLRKKEGRVKRINVYGGSVVENLSQALAGAYVKEAMVRMFLKGHRTILQVHDEVVCIADADKADQVLCEVNECMETVPAWAEGLPLAAEGDWALSYGEAK